MRTNNSSDQNQLNSGGVFSKKQTIILISIAVLCVSISWLTHAADFMNGARIYTQNCESCHGPNGKGGAGTEDLTDRYQLMKPDEIIFGVIRDGVMSMPGYDTLLTSDEILDVIAYMRTFQ